MSADGLNRRGFLSLAGAMPLGRMLLPAQGAAPAPQTASRSGADTCILMPRSCLAHRLGRSFQDGLAEALTGVSVPPPRVVELAIGATDVEIVAGGLLAQQEGALVIGALDARRAAEVQRLLGARALYLDMGFGALVPDCPDAGRRWLECSQGWWTSAYALGRWSGAVGKRAALVSTLFDAGFDGLYAFRLGFEESGGTIIATEVLDVPGRERLPAAVLAQLAACAPDAVYASLHDHHGQLLLSAWAQRPGALAECELLGTPQLASIANLAAAPALTVHTAATYDAALDLEANRGFVERFRARHGSLPDGTAVAGWEAGRLLAATAECAPTTSALRAAILGAVIDSPRGRIAFDDAQGAAVAAHYLVRCSGSAEGRQREVLGALPIIALDDPRVVAWQGSLRSGWTNPYLSI